MNYVQSGYSFSGSASTIAVTLPSAVTAGNCLVVGAGSSIGSKVITGVSDTLNGAWTGPAVSSSGFYIATMWVFPNSAAGSCTVTVSIASGSAMAMALYEFGGVAASAVVDVTQHNSSYNLPSSTTGTSAATSKAVQAVASFFYTTVTSHTWTPAAPGTLVTPSPAAYASTYWITSAAGPQVQNMTNEANTTYDAVLVALLPPAVTAPTTPTTIKSVVAIRSTSQS